MVSSLQPEQCMRAIKIFSEKADTLTERKLIYVLVIQHNAENKNAEGIAVIIISYRFWVVEILVTYIYGEGER